MGGFCSCFRGWHPEEPTLNNASAEIQAETFSLFSPDTLNDASEHSEPPVFNIPGKPRSTSSDEDVCPTCFEGYSEENPKITSKCNHHFHLGCIYDWQERSDTCPFCRQVIDFAEAAN